MSAVALHVDEGVDRSACSVVPRSMSGHDLDYWLTRSVEERPHAVQLQRLVVYGPSLASGGLPRILEVAERSRG
jgi:hypothetical protein